MKEKKKQQLWLIFENGNCKWLFRSCQIPGASFETMSCSCEETPLFHLALCLVRLKSCNSVSHPGLVRTAADWKLVETLFQMHFLRQGSACQVGQSGLLKMHLREVATAPHWNSQSVSGRWKQAEGRTFTNFLSGISKVATQEKHRRAQRPVSVPLLASTAVWVVGRWREAKEKQIASTSLRVSPLAATHGSKKNRNWARMKKEKKSSQKMRRRQLESCCSAPPHVAFKRPSRSGDEKQPR